MKTYTRGDHLRLKDVNVSYTFTGQNLRRVPVQQIKLYASIRDLGIIWRANRNGIDPDFETSEFPTPISVAAGLKIDF